MTKVVNIKEDYDVYIGRAGKGLDGYFGNSHVIGFCKICNRIHDRKDCIAEFKKDFYSRIIKDSEYKRRINELNGKKLGCFCKPNFDCHGDIIKEYLDNTKNKFYTGVGSRSVPPDMGEIIKKIGKEMAKKDYILRSGSADGSDSYFEMGCDLGYGKKEIYLPWEGFNDNNSSLYGVCKTALRLASTVHPAWDKLSQAAKKLHGRNIYQCLGKDLNIPSKVLFCWTENGDIKGGTRTAIVIAQRYNIPVYNLAIPEQLNKVLKKLKL